MGTAAVAPTMGDALAYWREVTGLEWFPDPATINRRQIRSLVDLFDSIITEQAKAIMCSHVTTQQQIEARLHDNVAAQLTLFKKTVEGLDPKGQQQLKGDCAAAD